MRTERIVIAVPYGATVVPRNGRKAREEHYRSEIVADVPVVGADEIVLAATCSDVAGRLANDPERWDYHGIGGSLFLQLRGGDEHRSPLRVEQAIEQLRAGHRTVGELKNPFEMVAASRLKVDSIRNLVPIEDIALRSVEREDGGASRSAASRLAADLVFCEDGRVFRRSIGPLWGLRSGFALDLIPAKFAFPRELHHAIGAGRLDEMLDFLNVDYAGMGGPMRTTGRLEVIEPDFLPDHDALMAARQVAQRMWAGHIHRQMEQLPPAHLDAGLEAGRAAVAGIARMHGVDRDEVVVRDNAHAREGFVPPAPEEMVAAVDAVRGFFENHILSEDGPAAPGWLDSYRRLNESVVAPALRRWDLLERDRLPVPEDVPELAWVTP